jgi:uncharacterized protein YifE (UPF0438 family)
MYAQVKYGVAFLDKDIGEFQEDEENNSVEVISNERLTIETFEIY